MHGHKINYLEIAKKIADPKARKISAVGLRDEHEILVAKAKKCR